MPLVFKKNEKEKVSYTRPFILGAFDGLVTTFVIITGGIAGNVPKSSITIIAASSLVADAFSMGSGEYLSSRSEFPIDTSFKKGITCFFSFMLFGSIPLSIYVFLNGYETLVTVMLFGTILLIIGYLRARLSKDKILKSLLEVFFVGSSTGAISYGVALLVNNNEETILKINNTITNVNST
tara:strand:- start:236 stop:778 length:543 start_codon:yes stop_codon:yes gene_type:complete